MKILYCYIENFGKLHACRFDFSDGITCVCEPNGYGKTTLAAFIKAMFYGLDSVRANSKELGERRRYCPFAGGKFGGSLTFSAGGSTFRIERFFDEKSGTRDTVAVYRDERPFNGFGDDIGGAVFGLDRQSFERTVFIGDGDIATQPTGSIAARLNAFAEGTQGDENIEAALAAIERAARKYKKSRQGGDLISAENAHIAELTHKLENATTIAAELPKKYERLAMLNAEAGRLTELIKQAQSANVAAADRESYERMKDEADRLEEQLRQRVAAYPKGMPAREEAEHAIACADDRAKYEAKLGQGFIAEDRARYAALGEQFKDGVPDKDALERAAHDIRRLASAEAQTGTLTNPRAQSDAEELERLLGRYNRAERAARSGAEKKSAKAYVAAAVIAAVAIVCGAALIITASAIAGALIAAGGGAALLVTAFIYLNRKAGANTGAATRELDEISAEIAALLAKYGYSCEGGAAYAAARFMQEVQPNGVSSPQTEELKRKLNAFFARYGKRGEPLSCLTELRTDVNEYAALDARLKAAEGRDGQLKAELDRLEAEVCATLKKYAIADVNGLRRAITDSERITEIRRELAERREAAEKFKKERGIDGRNAGGRIDADALNDRLTQVLSERQRLTMQISEDESYAERADDLAAERRDAELKLADYRERYDVLIKTAECLRQADENLKDRYVKPVRGQFGRYADALEQALGRHVAVGADFSLTFEQGGAVRSEEHLSAGELAICSLCLRLALTDNMYRNEKPFFVLDDPFAELDEEHMGKVKRLLRELSKTTQIIYFCCHPSRKV